MKRLAPLICLFALLLAPLGALADEAVSLKVGYINLTPDGKFASRDGAVNTTLDVEDDFDMDEDSTAMAEAALQLGPFRLSAGYLALDFEGTSTLTRDITFHGVTFGASERAKGEIDVDLFDLGLTWYLLNFDDLPLRLQLGPELSVKIIDGEASVTGRTTGQHESVSGTVAVPTVGARARVGLGDFLAVSGRVGVMEVDDNSFLDADAQVELSPIPLFGVFAGYRYLDLDVDEDDLLLDATFDGPYAGAFIRF